MITVIACSDIARTSTAAMATSECQSVSGWYGGLPRQHRPSLARTVDLACLRSDDVLVPAGLSRDAISCQPNALLLASCGGLKQPCFPDETEL